MPGASALSSPPDPNATSPTPAKESAAPIQNRRGSTSLPRASPISAAKIGVAAMISAITDAEVVLRAYTKPIWLSHSTAAAEATARKSRRSMRSDRSAASTIAMKTSEASPYRTVEYASGWKPWVRMYRLTVRLSAHSTIADSSITSTGVSFRMYSTVVVRVCRAMANPTLDDIEALVGPATPHFAYQIRARVRELIADLPEDHAVRKYAEEKIELLERLGYASSKAEGGGREPRSRPGWNEIPSSAPVDRPLPAGG